MHVGDFFPFPLFFLLLPAACLPKVNNLLCSAAAAAAVETTLEDDVELVDVDDDVKFVCLNLLEMLLSHLITE